MLPVQRLLPSPDALSLACSINSVGSRHCVPTHQHHHVAILDRSYLKGTHAMQFPGRDDGCLLYTTVISGSGICTLTLLAHRGGSQARAKHAKDDRLRSLRGQGLFRLLEVTAVLGSPIASHLGTDKGSAHMARPTPAGVWLLTTVLICALIRTAHSLTPGGPWGRRGPARGSWVSLCALQRAPCTAVDRFKSLTRQPWRPPRATEALATGAAAAAGQDERLAAGVLASRIHGADLPMHACRA